MQFKGESRCCERRQNYATAVNSEVNMSTSAPYPDTEKHRSQRRTSRGRNLQTGFSLEYQLLISAK